MNSQFKKGVLELIVLVSVNKRDMYGYELVLEVSKVVDVNEGTIYPLLKSYINDYFIIKDNKVMVIKWFRTLVIGFFLTFKNVKLIDKYI